MREYTPTTDEVREDFAFPWSPEQIGDRQARIDAFDRWLAAHDRRVAAQAWARGVRRAFTESVESQHWTPGDLTNPYTDGGSV